MNLNVNFSRQTYFSGSGKSTVPSFTVDQEKNPHIGKHVNKVKELFNGDFLKWKNEGNTKSGFNTFLRSKGFQVNANSIITGYNNPSK